MRAVLLAAGKATRLGALSHTTPKCLHQVDGQPLLDRIVGQLSRCGVNEFLINTHHLSDRIVEHVAAAGWKEHARLTHEKQLLGTLGTLRANAEFLSPSGGWILHADNYIAGELTDLRSVYEKRKSSTWGTMLAFRARHPENFGVVTMNPSNIMTGFYEKVANPPSNIASAATFILDPRAIELALNLPESCKDISRDLLPRLSGKLEVAIHVKPVIDIGTVGGLRRARQEAKQG